MDINDIAGPHRSANRLMALVSRRHLRTPTVEVLGAAYALINAGAFLRATAMPDFWGEAACERG